MKKIAIVLACLLALLLVFGCTSQVPAIVNECQTKVDAAVKATPMLEYNKSGLLDECISDRAVKAKDISICNYVQDADRKSLCITQVQTTLSGVSTNPQPTPAQKITLCSPLLTEADIKSVCGSSINLTLRADDNYSYGSSSFCAKEYQMDSPAMTFSVGIEEANPGNSIEDIFASKLNANKDYIVEDNNILGHSAWVSESTKNEWTSHVLYGKKIVEVTISEKDSDGANYPCKKTDVDALTQIVLNKLA